MYLGNNISDLKDVSPFNRKGLESHRRQRFSNLNNMRARNEYNDEVLVEDLPTKTRRIPDTSSQISNYLPEIPSNPPKSAMRPVPAIKEANMYSKPEYDEHDEKSKVYKINKNRIRERTFNDYNRFEIKNFDVKTDGSLVDYKPEFHRPMVKSNIFNNFN